VIVSILLLVGSLAFLVLEVLLVSFGAFGLIAAAMGVASIAIAFAEAAWFGWTMLGTLLVAAPLALVGTFRILPRLRFARGFFLEPPALGERDRRAAALPLQDLVGAEGEAVSPLRPAGAARFGERIVDVVTDGVALERGSRVRVREVSGNRVVVEPLPHS
jgi:membrane-bound serine protease (ClpP class)